MILKILQINVFVDKSISWLDIRTCLIGIVLLWWVSLINLASEMLLLPSIPLDWIINLSNKKIEDFSSSLSDRKPFGVISKPIRNEAVLSCAKEAASTSVITTSKTYSTMSSHNLHLIGETTHSREAAKGKSNTSIMMAIAVPYTLIASESLSH